MSTPWTPPPADGGPGAAPLAAPRAKIRPGRIWYLLGLLVFLAGVALLVAGPVSIFSRVDSFPRVAVPAGGQVSLNSGGYVIYYEVPAGRSVLIPRVRVQVAPASADAALGTMAPYSGTDNYSNGSRQGYAILTLQVTHSGLFAVTTPGQTDLPPSSDLAFGHSFGGGLVASIAGGILLIMAGLGGLIVIFIIRIVKTNRARSPVPAWSPPAGPPMQPPPAGPPMQPPPMQPPPMQPPPMQPPPMQP
jgi:hypothetical protein